MSAHSLTTVLMVLLAAAIAGAMLMRFRRTNVLALVAVYFFLTAFGPVLNLLFGAQIYVGTRRNEVAAACVGFTVALFGFLIADVLVPQRVNFSANVLRADVQRRGYRRYTLALVASALFMLVTLARNSDVILHGDKVAKVAALPGHYIVLFLEAALMLAHFAIWSGSRVRRAYVFNAIVYVGYCLLSDERDFLFVFFVILVHRALLAGRILSTKAVALGAVGVLFAGALVSLRSGSPFGLAEVLNQGSLLFVDTFVHALVPTSLGFQHGGTYLDSLHNLAPFGLGNNGAPPLSQWLVNNYAPGSSSGYGFSLTAEMYMNFGVYGIAVLFVVLGLIQRFAVNNMDRSLPAAFASMVVLFDLMYSIRGDSSQLTKTLFYAAIIYVALIMPVRQRSRRRVRRGFAPPVIGAVHGRSLRRQPVLDG